MNLQHVCGVRFCHLLLAVGGSYARPMELEVSRFDVRAGLAEPADAIGAPPRGFAPGYSGNLLHQADVYARLCVRVARRERLDFDLVRAHDWSASPAGMAVAAVSGKPLVAHVHSTEFDRSGERVNQRVYEIERAAVHRAQAVIAVSGLTRDTLASRYGVEPSKVDVVHNGVRPAAPADRPAKGPGADKVVLFLGRVTMQEGAGVFRRRRQARPGGHGRRQVHRRGHRGPLAADGRAGGGGGIGHRVLFAGFLGSAEVLRAFRMADVYVMPSVSEPFGIAPLEAASQGVPVILSRSSGVAEVLRHALKVDFGDVGEIANKIAGVLRRPALAEVLRENALAETLHLTWERAACGCLRTYTRRTGI